jgi:hypothetical protein
VGENDEGGHEEQLSIFQRPPDGEGVFPEILPAGDAIHGKLTSHRIS